MQGRGEACRGEEGLQDGDGSASERGAARQPGPDAAWRGLTADRQPHFAVANFLSVLFSNLSALLILLPVTGQALGSYETG